MKRIAENQLTSWKLSRKRKPLLMMGARQVGKTYLLNWLGQTHFENYIVINFEEDKLAPLLFQSGLSPAKIIPKIKLHTKQNLEPKKTLLIFDEIQLCNDALNSLKYFCETAPEWHVAAAGSLLGIHLSGQRSFPVGKVDFLNLYPMTFEEFLLAMGEQSLCNLLSEKKDFSPLPELFHTKLIDLLKQYFVVGGMPEAVEQYTQRPDFDLVRKVQNQIVNAYRLDFSKHAPATEVPKINLIWDSLPAQLGKENKKFLYSLVSKNARQREYENALQWLHDARLIYKTACVSTAKTPLSAYREQGIFKTYMLDVGLLGAHSGLDPRHILNGNRVFEEFKGALAENFVCNQLSAKFDTQILNYWTSHGDAEVDFLIENGGRIWPLEVKSGENIRSRSLNAFGEKYSDVILSRASLRNFDATRILNYPLYAVGNIANMES